MTDLTVPVTAIAIMVFTHDLRLQDNPVLSGAMRTAERVVPHSCMTLGWPRPDSSPPPRLRFLADCLVDLDHRLRRRGAALVVRHGDLVTELGRLADQTNAGTIHIADDVSAFAAQRRRRLGAELAGSRRDLVCHQGVHAVVPPGTVTPHGNDHFAVFTPYHRRWTEPARRDVCPSPERLRLPTSLDAPPVEDDRDGGRDPSQTRT